MRTFPDPDGPWHHARFDDARAPKNLHDIWVRLLHNTAQFDHPGDD